MAEVASAWVAIKPTTAGFGRSLESQIGGPAEAAGRNSGRRFGGGMSAGMAGMGTKIFAPLAAAGAAMVVGDFLKDAVGEARESQKVGALTAQVIKTTGGAARVTAGQVGDLATSISNKTGIDDEAIQSASNLLLTFTGVRNEVGKGNDIFSQATAISADMGAVMGTDAKSSAIQLGKALNDPIKGVGALSRVGVSFTAQQKAQIKTLVKSGDTLGAQKIILAELGKEFGGAAAASATAGEKFSTTFGNFKESVGTALLPILDVVLGKAGEFFGFLTTNVGPAVGKLGDAFKFLFSDGADGAQSFGEIVDNIFGNSGKLVGPMRVVGQVVKDVILGFRAMFLAFQDGDVTSDGIVGMFERIGVFGRDVVAFIQTQLIPGFEVFFSFLAGNDTGVDGPFREMAVAGTVLRGVLASVAAFIQAQVVPAFMGIVTAVRGFVAVALPIVQAFTAGMMARIGPMMPQIRSIFGQIGAVIISVMGLIQAVITRVTVVIGFIWSRWGTNIMDFVGVVFGKILVVIQTALGVIQGVIKTVTSVIKGDWSGAWNGIKQIVSSAWGLIKGIVSLGFALIKGYFSAGMGVIKALTSAGWGNVKTLISNAWTGIKSLISGALSSVKSTLSSAWSSIKSTVSTAWAGVKSLISGAWDSIKSTVVGKAAALVSFVAGQPARLASALASLGGLLAAKGSAAMTSLRTAISGGVDTVVTFVGGIPAKIVSAIGDLGKLLTEKGKSVVQGLIDGMGIPDVGGAISSIVGKITDFLPGSPVKEGPLRVLNRGYAGGQIVSMLTGGIDSQRASMAASMSALVQVPRVGSLDFASSAARSSAVDGAGGVNFYGNVGWDPDEVAARIAVRQRDAAALYNLAGV